MKWILSLLPFCTSHLAWKGSCLPGRRRGRPFLTGYPVSPNHPISLPEPALQLLQRASENKGGGGVAILFRNCPSSAAASPPVTCPPTSLQPMLRGGHPRDASTGSHHSHTDVCAEDVDTWKLFAAPCRPPAGIREPRGRKPANLRNHPIRGVSAPGFWGILLRIGFLEHSPNMNPRIPS